MKGSKTSLRREQSDFLKSRAAGEFTKLLLIHCFWMRIQMSKIKGDPER
jgi:hypothetical protein